MKTAFTFCFNDEHQNSFKVIQRRVNGNVSFDRDWADYQAGFGELDGDFWLGELLNMWECGAYDK